VNIQSIYKSISNRIALGGCYMVLIIATLGAPTLAQASVFSLAAVRDSSLPQVEYDAGVYSYTRSQLLSDNGIAEAHISTSNAMAQTDEGINRVYADNSAAVDDPFLQAVSIGGPFSAAVSGWYDQFTVTGGSGVGTLDVSTQIDGMFGPGGGSGASYFLFVATADQIANFSALPLETIVNLVDNLFNPPMILQFEQNICTGSCDETNAIPDNGKIHLINETLTGQLDFTYGEPFYLIGAMAAYANEFSSADFYNTAVFGITAPTGASIATTSGVSYPAASVPEPATFSLLGLGLIGLGLSHRRKAV